MLDLRHEPEAPSAREPAAGRYHPSLDEVAALAERGNIIPVYREIFADLETPVSAYLKVAHGPFSFLLESIEGGERLGRYSFIGADPYLTLKLDQGVAEANLRGYRQTAAFTDPLVAVREFLAPYRAIELPGLPRFVGGAVGFLGYDAVRYFERLPAPPRDTTGFPEAFFMFVDTMLVFDHLRRAIKVVSHVRVDEHTPLEQSYAEAVARVDELAARLRGEPAIPVGAEPLHVEPVEARLRRHTSPELYQAMVRAAKEYIGAGDIFQVVLSQRVSLPTAAHPFSVYRALRQVNPSPYMFYLHLGEAQIIGSSPELLVRLDGSTLTYHPIAGTRPRGVDEATDEALAEELAGDEKERAEHIMLVDLGRNDLGRVAEPGTVRVPQLMEIERFSHVMHLVSHLTAELRPELSGVDAIRACFPAGTVSGAPKIRAMEIIAELEEERRGPYSGAVGYVDFGGNLDTCIALRTLWMRDGVAQFQAGAGLVADSDPAAEDAECFHKLRALVRAVELAEEIERDARGAAEEGT
ncbi:MAG TPA: anthranilate synthase component I [Thermomicrobiaceae bacterium]|nr:anthranilate synthase component I [Thermomicrobiaceae bacterium]